MRVSTLFAILSAVSLTIAAASCSSNDDPFVPPGEDDPDAAVIPETGPAPITSDQACADRSTQLCTRSDTCSHYAIQANYGDLETCKTRVALDCKARLTAPKTGWTTDEYEACAGALQGAACVDLFAGALPQACQPVAGQLVNGNTCGDDSQCASAFCANGTPDQCGTCGPATREGDPCINEDCPFGLACIAEVCIKRAKENEACDAAKKPCVSGLYCSAAKADAGGDAGLTCSPGLKLGDTCDPALATTGPCDGTTGLFCNTQTLKCAAPSFVRPGDPCGLQTNGTINACPGTHYCKPNAGDGGESLCEPRALDKSACDNDPTKGAPCVAPAHCVAGACKIVDPTTCN